MGVVVGQKAQAETVFEQLVDSVQNAPRAASGDGDAIL